MVEKPIKDIEVEEEEVVAMPEKAKYSKCEKSENRKKCKCKPIIAGLSILAIAGIGFGVWGVIQNNNQSNEIDNLKVTISDKDKTIAELKTGSTIEISNPDGTTTIVSENASDFTKYLYIPSEGIKIELPKNVSSLSYDVNAVNHSIGLTLTTTDLIQQYGFQYVPDFLNPQKAFNLSNNPTVHNYLGYITIYPEGTEPVTFPGIEATKLTNGSSYVYSHPQAVSSTDEREKNLETASVQLVMDVLTKNVSAL